MEYLVICLASLAVSALTLFSGFGLGTLLAPVMALFFPVEAAVALTAVVHFANNAFKLALFGRRADRGVLLRFGLPAVLASFLGAWLLVRLATLPAWFDYPLFGRTMTVTPVKALVGALILCFAFRELRSGKTKKAHPRSLLPVGGVASGFFGGLSGHQGAFRGAFLLGAGLDKEAFVATGVAVACLVDATRLTVYAGLLDSPALAGTWGLLVAASLSAFLGVVVSRRILKKITLDTVRRLVGGMLLLLGAGLVAGVV